MHIITSNQQISTIGLKLIPNLTMHANKATPNTSTNKRSKPKAEKEYKAKLPNPSEKYKITLSESIRHNQSNSQIRHNQTKIQTI